MRKTVMALSVLLMWMACAPRPLQTLEPEAEPKVEFTPAMRQFMAMVHSRMTHHSKYPDHEAIACLVGTIEGSSIKITGIRPTMMSGATAHSVNYANCPRDTLGAWHTHPQIPAGDGCWFSEPDTRTFLERDEEFVQVVSCMVKDDTVRLLSRVKKGYSKR